MWANPRNQAPCFALLASMILSFIDNFVAAVSEEAGLWQFQVFRAIFAVIVLMGYSIWAGKRWRPAHFRGIALRSLAVSTGLMIYFATLGTLPVAEAGAGLFSAPIWVVVFSGIFFAVRIGKLNLILVVTGFIGVLLLLQPDFNAFTVLSILPLAAGAFYGLGMLLTSKLCEEESALSLALGIFLTMGLMSIFLLAYFTFVPINAPDFLTQGWVSPTLRFVKLTLFQAVGAVIAVSCIAHAYRIGEPSIVAVFEYSFLIFAGLWAYLLWGSTINVQAMLGIAIILLSGTAMSLIAYRQDR